MYQLSRSDRNIPTMKIAKSVSEKITFKDRTSDTFHTREFAAFREVSIPDNSLDEVIRYTECALDYELRKQVLTNFLLEAVITADQMQRTLTPYESLMNTARDRMEAILTEETGISPKN